MKHENNSHIHKQKTLKITSLKLIIMHITGAKAIIHVLLQLGVKDIFGYPGGAIMPTYDELFHEDGLRHILVRHEQGAAIAAEGYARLSGKVGVCIATSGPGATNLMTGIADAMLDSIPIVCITGQVHSTLIGTDAFQEVDIIGMSTPITKWSYQITKAEEIPNILVKAFYIASCGRPGPVLIEITKDAQLEQIKFDPTQINNCILKLPDIPKTTLQQAAELINNAKRPYIFAGHGVTIANAEVELLNFAKKSGIPIACTLHGLSTIDTNDPLYVGLLGMHGNYAPNRLTNEADIIIAIGMRFDNRVTGNLKTYAQNSKIIHIDIDMSELGKNVPVEIAICGDAKQVLTKLINYIMPNNHDDWINKFKEQHQIEYKKVIKQEITPNLLGKIKMAEVIHKLSEKTAGNAVIVTDVGQHQMIAARYYQFRNPRSHITSGGLGTMGFALPAAIGAKVAEPKKEVIAIIGDGGFQMNIQELGILLQENLKIKIIILNNEYLGMVRQWQEMFFEERYSSTHLVNPSFIKIAEAYSIPALYIKHEEDLNSGIDALLKADSSFILEVLVEKHSKVFPMVPSGSCISDIQLS